MQSLDGQTVIITGGGTGIGRACALAFAAQGARVAVIGRRPEPLAEVEAELIALGATTMTAALDVSDPKAVFRCTKEVLDRWGRIDVLVNNAGVNVQRRALANLSPDDWDMIVRTNLTGTFLMAHAVLPTMRTQRSGTIVNISALAGYRPAVLTGPAYSAAKAGVNSLTESINLADRENGIRACAICPGEVSTPFLDQRSRPPSGDARAIMLQPEDLARTILFVATLPPRAMIELLLIRPTLPRNFEPELEQVTAQ